MKKSTFIYYTALARHSLLHSQATANQDTTYTMAALELAQSALADTPVPKKFLDGLVGKGYLTEENKQGILDDEELCRFITKGRAQKASTKKVSDEERDNAEYDPLRCPCRIWKPLEGCGDVAKGMNIQCSKKLPDDMSMCKMHSGKLDEDGLWWLGLVTEDPPAQPFFQPGKKKAHYWSLDAKEEEKEKKKAGKKTKKVEEPESDEEVDPEEDAEKKRLERKKKMAKMKAQKEKSSMEKGSKKSSKKKTSLEEQQEKIAAAAEKRAAAREAAKKKLEEESDEELEADEDGNTPYIFEGVKYLKTEDGDIVDPETFDLMGEDDGAGGIDWSDSEMLEKHEEKRDSLK